MGCKKDRYSRYCTYAQSCAKVPIRTRGFVGGGKGDEAVTATVGTGGTGATSRPMAMGAQSGEKC